MFTNITIKNFRCFSALQLPDLGRVNLIAGKNNTGKTAVLEAIQLHNQPSDSLQELAIGKQRGLLVSSPDSLAILGWLFYRQALQSTFEIETLGIENQSRKLTGCLIDVTADRERFPDFEKKIPGLFSPVKMGGSPDRLVLWAESTGGPTRYHVSSWDPTNPSVSSRIPRITTTAFVGALSASAEQDPRMFGELEAAKRQGEILPALQILEPRLERLTLIPMSGRTIIHGDIGLPRMIPINMMGEGLRRLLSILLAIANTKGGVVLIDEVENGLHHSVLKQFWQAIAIAARQLNVQIFATTHSYECIQAAHVAFQDSEQYDLKLLRLERSESSTHAIAYDQTTLDTAVEMNMEVR